eukprot:3251027-Rhodomonas_salina.1
MAKSNTRNHIPSKTVLQRRFLVRGFGFSRNPRPYAQIREERPTTQRGAEGQTAHTASSSRIARRRAASGQRYAAYPCAMPARTATLAPSPFQWRLLSVIRY